MSWLSGIGNFLGKALDVVTDVIPGGNLVQSAVELVVPQAESFFSGSMGGGTTIPATPAAPTYQLGGAPMSQLPALPGIQQVSQVVPSNSMPLPAMQTQAAAAGGPGGLPVPFWKGPGGKLQLPWNDPRVAEYLKPYSLDDAYLKPYYRAPKGFVVLKDASGRPFAVQKEIAKFFGLWKPAAKPPISATDWKHYKRNKAIEKKLTKVAAPVIAKARKSARDSASRKKSTRR